MLLNETLTDRPSSTFSLLDWIELVVLTSGQAIAFDNLAHVHFSLELVPLLSILQCLLLFLFSSWRLKNEL